LFYSIAFAILYEIFHMATMVALSERIGLAGDMSHQARSARLEI
jgi:hypothetical protein